VEALTPLLRLGIFSWIVTHICIYVEMKAPIGETP